MIDNEISTKYVYVYNFSMGKEEVLTSHHKL